MKEQSQLAWKGLLKLMNDRLNELQISRYELSKRSALDQAAVKRILEGNRDPSVSTCIQLLVGLELNLFLIESQTHARRCISNNCEATPSGVKKII